MRALEVREGLLEARVRVRRPPGVEEPPRLGVPVVRARLRRLGLRDHGGRGRGKEHRQQPVHG